MRKREVYARIRDALVRVGWLCRSSDMPLYDFTAYKNGFKVIVKCVRSLKEITDDVRFMLCEYAVRNSRYKRWKVYVFFASPTSYGLFLIDALNFKRVKPIELEAYLKNQRKTRPFQL
ncbi:hypothetical protein J7L00_03470 [Candidatus Bathyarchaeota archaeon]|nr:hypothetical protein [Candidatus Bathyarchaeota archaeon]